jgi:putative SOS response-associated peptidase YedK
MSPTNSQEIITKQGDKIMKWGFPFTNLMINIRSESNAFMSERNTNRCLVPVDGFYEWKKEGSKKLPYFIKADSIFYLGGIYQQINGEYHYCIMTTEVAPKLAFVHNRMPVNTHN